MSNAAESRSNPQRRVRGVFLTTLVIGTTGLIVWSIYLGWRLPRVYVASHWDLAWVGFDVAQIMVLLLVTWSAYRRRIVLVVFTTVAATMFVIDGWFDATTARSGEFHDSLIAAIGIELPAAVVLFSVSWIVLRRIADGASTATGAEASSLWRSEIPQDERGFFNV